MTELTTLETMLTDEEILGAYEDSNDPDQRTHIVNPPKNTHIWQPGMTAQEIVDIARATQQEVVALCGFRFIPKHNPDKYDACEVCIKIAGDLIRERG